MAYRIMTVPDRTLYWVGDTATIARALDESRILQARLPDARLMLESSDDGHAFESVPLDDTDR